MVVRELAAREEVLDERQSGGGSVAHRHRGGAVQLDDRRRVRPQQHVVERRRSAPSRSRPRPAPRRAPRRSPPAACTARAAATASARSHQRRAFRDHARGSSASGPDRPAGPARRRRRARRAPRLVQQHQREQPDRLGLRQQLDEQPPEPDRLGGEIVPRERLAGRSGVAFVEDEIDRRAARCRAGPAARPARAPGRGCVRRGSWPWRGRSAAPPSGARSGTRWRSPRW